MWFFITPLLFALLGVCLACMRRLPVMAYLVISFLVPATVYLALLFHHERIVFSASALFAVCVFHLLPFMLFFYMPVQIAYFSTLLIQHRYCRRERTI